MNILKIKPLREQAGLSQQQLAELLDVTQPLIAAYESGDRLPNVRRLPAIATALGVKIVDLFSPVDEQTDPIHN